LGYTIDTPKVHSRDFIVYVRIANIDSSSPLGCNQGLAVLIVRLKLAACRVAIKCLCGILDAVPHFNFMSDVLQVLVPKLNSVDERSRGLATASLQLLLQRGTHGDVMLEAVQLIADLVRTTKCKCYPDCVVPLRALAFPDISRDDVSKGMLCAIVRYTRERAITFDGC
jgi:hypothetical protein